ncbi:MAG: hypothetical protein JWN03_341 [Nocardia sp.]|uniref:hypothetical protein n=1 Tax=Nocardia sp. TaxID=1821 RepID=UPI0026184B0E|nr:hypothetical protein [Nocardia sp.]MCU1640066.1 hypothetical protein [Nocardia sp.]
MPNAVKIVTALAVATALSTVPIATSDAAVVPTIGSCSGGDFRWTAVDGAIGMSPRQLTFTSVGRLWDCLGVPGITGGTFTGVHVAVSDCMHPADGPLTVDILWSDGETSKLWGPWPVGMMQPTIGPMEVVGGLGQGGRVRVVAEYEMMTPDMVMGCMGLGVTTGPGRLSASMW